MRRGCAGVAAGSGFGDAGGAGIEGSRTVKLLPHPRPGLSTRVTSVELVEMFGSPG
jgi:hypothetical protein